MGTKQKICTSYKRGFEVPLPSLILPPPFTRARAQAATPSIVNNKTSSHVNNKSNDMTSPVPDTASLKKMRVADLKELLEARSLDSTGKKDDLVARLDALPREEGGDTAAADAPAADDDAPAAAAADDDADAKMTDDAAAAAPKPLAQHVSEATGQGDATATAAATATPAGPSGSKIYVGFLGENCNRQFIVDLFADYFLPDKIFIATQQRGHLKVPKGYAFVDGPAGESRGGKEEVPSSQKYFHFNLLFPFAKVPAWSLLLSLLLEKLHALRRYYPRLM
jgi:hypothetical protein